MAQVVHVTYLLLSCASVGQPAGAEPPTPSHPARLTGSYGYWLRAI